MTTLIAPRSARSVADRPPSTVRRLEARYRLPASREGARARLDRVLRFALDDVLEAAFDRAGVSASEEICVRLVHIVARLQLDATDSELAVSWSLAVADALSREIRDGGPNIVRYGSRQQAFVDIAISAARGDSTRAWAWRQIGLWNRDEDCSHAALAIGALEALESDARMAAPVLAELARRGALVAFAALAPVDRWLALERAALDAAGLDDRVRGGNARGGTRRFEQAETATIATVAPLHVAPDIARAAARIVRDSAIASAISDARSLAAATFGVLTTFAILEAAPHVTSMPGSRAAELLAAVRASITAAAMGEARLGAGMTADARLDRSHAPGASSLPHQPTHTAPGIPAGARADATTHQSSRLRDGEPVVAADEARESAREGAITRAGGLLFLLHIVRDTDLPALIVAHSVLGERSLAWSLHRFALRLAQLEPTDPAALAFCGRRPVDDVPGKDDPAASPAEIAALDECRDVVIASLRERLGVPDESSERLLASVIRRRAEIVADPGWIEARFALEEVSVPLRRAGLDLDLDWVPWLGVVVRFVYG